MAQNPRVMNHRYRPEKESVDRMRFAEKVQRWFWTYSPEQDGRMGPDGIIKFCRELNINPEDVVMLIIAYKMNAQKMCYFTCDEWTKGMQVIGCDSLHALKEKLGFLKNLLNFPDEFKKIHNYAFDFAKEEDNRRYLDIDTAVSMLKLLGFEKKWLLAEKFFNFLQEQHQLINKDQWTSILDFAETINGDLTKYDPDAAFPTMFDEFVEWLLKK